MLKQVFFVFFTAFIVLAAGCANRTIKSTVEREDVFETNDENEKPYIIDLNVEANSQNLLSCRLSFSTTEKKEAFVRYFSEKHKGYEVTGEISKDHYFFLWGMKPETRYTIEIYFAGNPEVPVEVTEYISGSLPETVPHMELTVNDRNKVSEGFVLFTYFAIPMANASPVALMVDEEGDVVWYFEYFMSGFNLLGDLQYIEETETILISLMKGPNMAKIPAEEAIEIDLEGNVVWKSKKVTNIYGDEDSWHHFYRRLKDNSLLFLGYEWTGSLVTDRIVNVDRDYNVLWTWSYLDHFDPPHCDSADICDWTHSNFLNMFKEEGVVYINSRNLSQYFKIDMDTGEVLWTFGKGGDFDMITDHPDPWFEFAHAPEIDTFDGNEIMFYDNGSEERGYSRIIKYRINDVDMTAEVIFEFDGSHIDRKWFTRFWGDVDTLDNGNIFITAGAFEATEETRLFEITKDGEIVWEMSFDPPEKTGFINAIYNSQKFRPDIYKNK